MKRYAVPALAALHLMATAAPLPADPLERRCWLAHTAERTRVDVLREPIAVHFSNLKSGDSVRSPFWVEFGVRGMGVIPAGNPREQSGHHHILIDTPLPRDHTAAIPFSDTHRHFGKGQTGALLDLPPGRHTLRLLFADHAHRPYFVFSPEISIQVTGKRAGPAPQLNATNLEASCTRWYGDYASTPRDPALREVYVKNLRAEEGVASPFTVSLGVAGLGVAPAGSEVKDTGHFRLQVLRGSATAQSVVLADGRTETVLDLPAGDYELQPSLLDGKGAPLLAGTPLRVTVLRQMR
jgi:hypothetical protein